MSGIRTINGIGTGLFTQKNGDRVFTLELPLTQEGGYNEVWSDETIVQRSINMDPDTRDIEELQIITDGFGNWLFDYSNIPMPNSFVIKAVTAWNNRKTHTGKLTPKSQTGYGVPTRTFDANLIGQEGLSFITGDSVLSPGTFGIKLTFRTVRNQMITVAEAQGIAYNQPGGSVFTPIEGSN